MGRRAQDKFATRARMFDAAIELIDAQGYDDTSIEDICSRAGVGRATFFRHFESKAGLLRVFNHRLAVDARQRIALGADDPVDRLRHVADAVHDAWITSSPGLRRLGAEATAASDPTGERTHPDLLALILEIVRGGLSSGDLRSELPPHLVAYLVASHLVGAAAWWIRNPDEDLRRLLDGALTQCLTGVAPHQVAPDPSRRRAVSHAKEN